MYYIVEFLDELTVAVVPNTWMVNLDSCRWPPATPEWKSKITKMVKMKSKPEDSFETYKVRVLGTSESLKRANEKVEKANYTSDINTTDNGKKVSGRPKRRGGKRKIEYSSSESDDNISSEEEPHVYISPPAPPTIIEDEQPSTIIEQPSQLRMDNIPPASTSQPLQQLLPCSLRREIFNKALGRPPSLENIDTSNMNQEALLRLNAEFHKQILRKLKLIETDVINLRERNQTNCSCSSQHPNKLPSLPFDLPVTSDDGLKEVEAFLETEANQDIMVRHLKLVGGAELSTAVRGIMSRTMSNAFASCFSFNGLRNKRTFKSLKLKKVVFSAVQLLYPEVTEAEFSKIAGDWFRYAPRKKGGSKERGSVKTFENLVTEAEVGEDYLEDL